MGCLWVLGREVCRRLVGPGWGEGTHLLMDLEVSDLHLGLGDRVDLATWVLGRVQDRKDSLLVGLRLNNADRCKRHLLDDSELLSR